VIGIDVVGSFARFIEASLLSEGFALVHTPGIAVNRAGQGFAGGERKSDPRDARTIAELVRTRDLRPVLADDDTRVALRLKVGRRRDLMQDQVRRIARIRRLLCGIHPALEQALDLCSKGPLALLTRYVTPSDIRRAGKARIKAHLRKTPHLHGCEALATRAVEIAKAQRITVPGEVATAELIRELAGEALEARQKIIANERDLEGLLARHPDYALIRSLPGMGVILTAEFLAAVGDMRRFTSADALACAAGLAPVQRQSGNRSGWRRAYGGDKALKRVFYQSAFCAVSTKDPLPQWGGPLSRVSARSITPAELFMLTRFRTQNQKLTFSFSLQPHDRTEGHPLTGLRSSVRSQPQSCHSMPGPNLIPGCPSFPRIQRLPITSGPSASPGTSSRQGTSSYLSPGAVRSSA